MQFITYMLFSRYLHLYYYSKSNKTTIISLPTYPQLDGEGRIGETNNNLILASFFDMQINENNNEKTADCKYMYLPCHSANTPVLRI